MSPFKFRQGCSTVLQYFRQPVSQYNVIVVDSFYYYLQFIRFMILNNTTHTPIQTLIQNICQQSLGYFVDHLPLSRSNFPILEITYTLWRKSAYERIRNIIKQKYGSSIQPPHKQIFYKLSQKKYLPCLVQRIKSQMNTYRRGLLNIQRELKQMQRLPKKQQLIYELILELGEHVWQQQLYLQLIQDLIHLPYLQIISSKTSIAARSQYATDYIFQRKNQNKISQVANNAGKNIFNKILTVVTQTVFSKTFVLKVNTLFGTFNPLVIGASFGLSQYLNHLDIKKKNQQIEVQLNLAIDFTKNKVDKMKQIYTNCLQQIQEILTLNSKQHELKQKKKTLKTLFLTVFQEEWLQIQIVREQDGWQVVKLEQKQSYQQLE